MTKPAAGAFLVPGAKADKAENRFVFRIPGEKQDRSMPLLKHIKAPLRGLSPSEGREPLRGCSGACPPGGRVDPVRDH